MGDSDAEWIDVDREFGTPKPQGPNRPPPRPRTSTFRPRYTTPSLNEDPPRPRIPTDNRPRRPLPDRGFDAPDRPPMRPLPGRGFDAPDRPSMRPLPGRGFDAPDSLPSGKGDSYKTTTISVSVVSVIILLALISLLLYLFVLRKKLKKVKKSQTDSQFCLRVEDVTHMDIDDSSKLYVNTTDLQKLVSSVRIKNKKVPPPIPNDGNFPDVIKVSRPPAALPLGSEPQVPVYYYNHNEAYGKDEANMGGSTSSCNDGYRDSSSEVIYANEVQEDLPPPYQEEYNVRTTVQIARPAPPPPTTSLLKANKHLTYVGSEENLVQEKTKPPPPVLPKPKTNINPNKNITQEIVKPTAIKDRPILPTKLKPNPHTNAKPNITELSAKPLLPRLKMNLSPSVNRQDSGFSTPDTAISYISDRSSASLIDQEHFEPEKMSVKDKMALLEGVIANEGSKRNT